MTSYVVPGSSPPPWIVNVTGPTLPTVAGETELRPNAGTVAVSEKWDPAPLSVLAQTRT